MNPPLAPLSRAARLAPRLRAGWRWVGVPLLAVAAYAPALSVRFVSDDWLLLYAGRRKGFDLDALLPPVNGGFYRPVGSILSWELGWQLWGANPLPYHVLGVLLHALAALALAGCQATATGRRGPAWLAGALFAVFPLHLEAVAWAAAQWDLWAAVGGIGSLWAFAAWWRAGGGGRYAATLALYILGLGSKESLLFFFPLFALTAWLANPRGISRPRRHQIAALLPFGLLGVGYLVLRLGLWGTGGMQLDTISLGTRLLADGRVLIAPLNAAIWGPGPGVVLAGGVILALAAGLVAFGRRQGRVLLVAGACIGLALAPVLHVAPRTDDLEDNRLLYLAAAGYCVGLAALLGPALAALRPALARGLLAAGLLASAAVCWVQLDPWIAAGQAVDRVGRELDTLLPPPLQPYGMTWYVQNLPDNIQGAYLLRLGLGDLRYFTSGEQAAIVLVADADAAPLAAAPGDAVALRFRPAPPSHDPTVEAAAAITGDSQTPTRLEPGGHGWDLRSCAPAVLAVWPVAGATTTCTPGAGLVLRPTGAATLTGPDLALSPGVARFVRLRVALRVPTGPPDAGTSGWAWRDPSGGWSPAPAPLSLKPDGQFHVYWSFWPATTLPATLTGVRLTPTDPPTPVTIAWIALDPVP